MAEGYEACHVPQQSRRDKLRVVVTRSQQQKQQQEGMVESSTFLPLYDSSLISSSDLLTTFHNNNNKHNFGSSVKEGRSNLMMRFAASSSSCSSNSSSVSCLDPQFSLPLNQASIQVIHNNNNNNMFLYEAQNIRDFDQSYNNNDNSNGSGEMMVFKPEPFSLSLSSSHNNNNNNNNNNNSVNLERYGTVAYGVGGGCVNYGGSASNEVSRGTVPMGPFTSYASLLKGSRFLKPAQQLLEELCDVGVCAEKIVADASLTEPIPIPPSSQISSEGPLAHHAVHGSKKSRLLTMLDEVYRRYRQYYQQMHAVVTSFEYVSGFSNAAPYASLAIKAMSKHFRCLKNAITDQLQFANKAHFHMSRKDESPRFGNRDRGTYSQRPGFLEQQPVWRPQRGLPECAVTVLRAWLFEHFLHPYPTDSDKLMLAKQTGLSRSQVSNWFINARVRLWKPMVEEIHLLETRQAQKNSQKEEQHRNKSTDHLPSDNSIVSENQSTSTDKLQDSPYRHAMNELPNLLVRNQEERNLPCRGNQPGGVGVSIGGGGYSSVSLTLGLHQNQGIGLAESFPLSSTQHFGVVPAANNEGYVMSGFDSQNRHFGRDVITGQPLHYFVG